MGNDGMDSVTFRLVLEAINESLVTFDPDGTIHFANPSAERLFGLSTSPTGKKFFELDIFDEGTTERLKELFFNRSEQGDDPPQEFRAVFMDGIVKWFRIDPIPIRDRRGKVTGLVTIIDDITERKEFEHALNESESRFRTVVDSLQEGLGITDLDDRMVYANSSLSRLCGCSTDELIGSRLSDLFSKERSEGTPRRPHRTQRGTTSVFRSKILVKGGGNIDVMVSTAPWTGGSGAHLGTICLFLDISERNKAEKALRESEEKYRATVEQSAENIYIYDIEAKKMVESNSALRELLGYTAEEMKDISPSDFIAHSEKNIQEQVARVLKRGKAIIGERTYFRKDGSLVDVEVSASHILHGDRAMLCVVSRDVTEKKKAREQLIEERNRAEFYLDLLAHDIGNLHHGILTGIDMVQLSEGDPDRRERSLKLVKDLLLRSIKLVDNVMTFSNLRSMPLQTRAIGLRPIMEKGALSANDAIPGKVMEHTLKWKGGDIQIIAEPLLQEAFFNIYHNAIKYHRENVVDVETSVEVKNGKAVIRISDTGPGIPDDRKDTIFDRVNDPLKRQHTGLGMSIVKALVERYGGTVQVQDRIKGDYTKGSTFMITLPIAPDR